MGGEQTAGSRGAPTSQIEAMGDTYNQDVQIKPNIYQRINAVMRDCDYIQKEKAQQGQGVKYDTVIAMLRPLMIRHGVVMVVRQIEMECVGGVEGTKQKVYQGKYEMDLVNIDDPKDLVTHSTFAHGMDGGDKAPGKAQTYAVKILLVKGFGVETGIDEESRAEKLATVTETQIKGIKALLGGDEDLKNRMLGSLNVEAVSEIPRASFNTVTRNLKKAKQ